MSPRPSWSPVALWRQMTRGLRVLAHRRAADEDIADEVEHFYAEATAELRAQGIPPEAAQRAVRQDLGNILGVREEVRSYGWENAVATFATDLRYAARRLRADPGFAALGVLTLALGLGASTAIFSAIYPILLAPLPYPQAARILGIWDRGEDSSRASVTFGTYRELAARNRSFAALAVWKAWQPAMTGPAQTERFEGQFVSAGYLRVLGVAPALGRDFDPADDHWHGPKAVLLSDGLWRRRFGADRTIVGRPIELDGDAYTVIGVLPQGFENVLAPRAEIWSLLQYDTALPPAGKEWGHHLRLVGRLAPGVGRELASRELAAIAHTPRPDFPRPAWSSLAGGLLVTALQDDVTRAVRPALLAVLGAVSLVLLIACVNVTNLLLAHGARRRGELAMRAALGAGRGRLLRQLVTESLLLAGLGGAFGMVVAKFGIQALLALSPSQLPRVGAIRLDGAVFTFAFAATTLTGLIVGLVPALQASRGERPGSPRVTGGPPHTRRALVVAQVALALVLLVCAGLLLRSLEQLFAVSPGFATSHLLTMQVQTYGHRYDDDETTKRFYAQALDSVRQVPGVAAAAFTSELPLSGEAETANVFGVHFEQDRNPGDDHDARRAAVSPGYFETLGIPLLRGRRLTASDRAGAAPRPVLLNESFARRKFPGQDPIGQRLRLGGAPDRPWDVIVGVVGDVKQTSLAVGVEDVVYVSNEQWLWADNPLWLVIRTRADAATLASAARRAIASVDKDSPIVHVATMDARLAASAAERRFVLILFAAFALAALTLAVIGIYGVVSGSVAERRREIGVRSALGATSGALLTLVMRQGMTFALCGVALGLLGATAASQALVALLFGVSPLDPVTYGGVVALLLLLSVFACGLPALRAAAVDPSITLRRE